jgi:hypothetical protein
MTVVKKPAGKSGPSGRYPKGKLRVGQIRAAETAVKAKEALREAQQQARQATEEARKANEQARMATTALREAKDNENLERKQRLMAEGKREEMRDIATYWRDRHRSESF